MQITVDLNKDEVIQNLIENNFNPDIEEFILKLVKEIDNYPLSFNIIIGIFELIDIRDEDKAELLKIIKG